MRMRLMNLEAVLYFTACFRRITAMPAHTGPQMRKYYIRSTCTISRYKQRVVLPRLTCVEMSVLTSVSSRIGPKFTSKTFRIVRFVVSGRPVSAFVLSLTKRSVSKNFRMVIASVDGGFLNSAFEGYRRPVSLPNLPDIDQRWQ